jgi:hypothetical protein
MKASKNFTRDRPFEFSPVKDERISTLVVIILTHICAQTDEKNSFFFLGQFEDKPAHFA